MRTRDIYEVLAARYEASISIATDRSRTCSAAADTYFESGAAMDLQDDATIFGLSLALLAVAYAIGRVVGPKVTKCETDEQRRKQKAWILTLISSVVCSARHLLSGTGHQVWVRPRI